MAEPERPQLTIQYRAKKMRFACQNNIGKNMDTHSEYYLLIIVNSSTKYFAAQKECKGCIFMATMNIFV
jgi:hypothetical protein